MGWHSFPIPLGVEWLKPGEGEVECAIWLLSRLVKDLGKRYFDIVVGDALYCRPSFFNACSFLGLHAIAILKENQHELIREAFW